MKIARARRQMPLIDIEPTYKVVSTATARNAYGDAAEEIVCRALGLDPIAIDGSCSVCFDAERHGMFYEIKSVRQKQKVVLYNWRMLKEANYSDRLYYAILVHNCFKERGNVFDRMLSGSQILLLPCSAVHAVANTCPTIIPKVPKNPKGTRNGYTRKGYVDGYKNVPIDSLIKLATTSEVISIRIFGRSLKMTVLK